MPELPEVECVRRTLDPSLSGRRISRVRVGMDKLARPNPQAFRRGLSGKLITGTSRHGKLLLALLEGGGYWCMHLGMTGQMIIADRRPQAKHIHIAVSFDDGGPKLYYRDIRQFGYMAYAKDQKALQEGPLANFGPDAQKIPLEEFIARMRGRKAPIKSLLLDQRILAGVGNIYADESLHRAHLSPLARPIDLDDSHLAELHHQLGLTLDQALAQGGSSIQNFVDAKGRAGTFQHAHRVYQCTGQPCPNCGHAVERIVLGGRSTHYCPNCQHC